MEPKLHRVRCPKCHNELIYENNRTFVFCSNCGIRIDVNKDEIDVPSEGEYNFNDNTSQRIDNLYILARRAKDVNDIDAAIKYYEEILLSRPNDWEANFFPHFLKCVGGIVDKNDTNIEINKGVKKVRSALNESAPNDTEYQCAYTTIKECIMRLIKMCNDESDSEIDSSDLKSIEKVLFKRINLIKLYNILGTIVCPEMKDYNSSIEYCNTAIVAIRSFTSGTPLHDEKVSKLFKGILENLNNTMVKMKDEEEKKKKEEEQRNKEEEQRKNEEVQKRYIEYWNNHLSERNILETEKSDISRQINNLKQEATRKLNNLKCYFEKETKINEIKRLEEMVNTLKDLKARTILPNKKQRLQEEINNYQWQIDYHKKEEETLNKKIKIERIMIEEELECALSPLKKRIESITTELTKAK